MACTMPGFPDKFMPFMEEDRWGAAASNFEKVAYGPMIRFFRHRNIKNKYDKEPELEAARQEPRNRLPTASLREMTTADERGA